MKTSHIRIPVFFPAVPVPYLLFALLFALSSALPLMVPADAAAQPDPARTRGSFTYDIQPSTYIKPLTEDRFEIIIPKTYFEQITQNLPLTDAKDIFVTLRFHNIDTTRDYIIYDDISGKIIEDFTIMNKEAASTVDGVISFKSPSDSIKFKMPVDHTTASRGKIGLSVKGINRQGAYDLEKQIGYIVGKLTLILKTPYIRASSSTATVDGESTLELKVDDFNLSYVLMKNRGKGDLEAVNERDKTFVIPFMSESTGGKTARYCLWPNFAGDYNAATLEKDIRCTTFTDMRNDPVDVRFALSVVPEAAKSVKRAPTTAAAAAPATTGKAAQTPAATPAPAAAAASAVKVRLRSDSDPGDTIRIEGQNIGPTPVYFTFRPGKTYRVELHYVRDNGGGQKTYYVTVQPDGKVRAQYKTVVQDVTPKPGIPLDLWLNIQKDRTKDFRLVPAWGKE